MALQKVRTILQKIINYFNCMEIVFPVPFRGLQSGNLTFQSQRPYLGL